MAKRNVSKKPHKPTAIQTRSQLFTPKERADILDDLQYIFDNGHKSLNKGHRKFIAEFIRMASGSLWHELETLKDSSKDVETCEFPGLILDGSIFKAMDTRRNAVARGYLAWRDPNGPNRRTPFLEIDYSDHQATIDDQGVTLGLRGLLVRKDKKSAGRDIDIDIAINAGSELFRCPFPKFGIAAWDQNRCNNRTDRLFLPRGSKDFGCASCHGLTATNEFWTEIEYISYSHQTRKYWEANKRKRHATYVKETTNARKGQGGAR